LGQPTIGTGQTSASWIARSLISVSGHKEQGSHGRVEAF
jgi:hypothetical protein